MNKTVAVLLVIVLVLLLAAGGVIGFLWYRDNHVFVEGEAYSIHEEYLDLRDKQISMAHYDQLQYLLPDCEIIWNVPFQGKTYSNDTQSIQTEKLNKQDAELLMNYFPRLQSLNASGCKDYALLEALSRQRPNWKITYQVDIGGSLIAPDANALELKNGEYDYDTLMNNLPHLPDVTSIFLHTPELTLEQMQALQEAYPDIALTCTVEILGREYESETAELNLADMTSEELPQVLEKLAMLPRLEKLELMKDGQSKLEKEDVRKIMEAVPEVAVHYTFDFFGQTLSTDQESVEFVNKNIGDSAEQELRDALSIMPKCKRFVLDNCKFSNEVLAKIREDFRGQTKVVWRVWFGEGGSSLTDATALRMCGGLYDSNCTPLKYCEDVVYMDIGHCDYLNDCDFISGMPNLEYLIISGSSIKTLEPFRVCKKLKFLELAFCAYIKDASPLADCESLEMLNISNTHITDLSPLDNLPLTHMVALAWETKDWMPADQKAAFKEKHPDCWTQFGAGQPYGAGWRYTSDNKGYLPYYQQIRDVFFYDKFPACPDKKGWYYEEKTVWTKQE